MTATAPDPLIAACFLVLAMGMAGLAHVVWLHSSLSRYFSAPLDAGITYRGRRLLGTNKMVRGFIVMPPAAGIAFCVLDALWPDLAAYPKGIWALDSSQFFVLGFSCGLGFMVAELPNSMFKRQLDITPGAAAAKPELRLLCMIIDRIDSEIGVLIVASLLVPVPFMTWFLSLVMGVPIHAAFSILLHQIGQKARPL